MKNKIRFLNMLLLFLVVTGGVLVIALSARQKTVAAAQSTDVIGMHTVSPQIIAEGTVTAANTATLHFQTGGKLIFLPFKEGDSVSSGQTIAQLDTYQLQRQLSAALNSYRSTRDTFDQTKDNATTGVLQGQQRFGLDVQNKVGITDPGEHDVIADMAKRIVDQNQANLDNSVINVELANYALQLSSLPAPFSGIITHEDVTTPSENVTPATSFTIIDPTSLVFRTNILEKDIDFVQTGAFALVELNGRSGQMLHGTVSKIYPQKTTLANGEQVYQVDITTPDLIQASKLDQTGIVTITSSVAKQVMLVPAWVVLDHQFVWREENNHITLQKVKIGKVHGSDVEVIDGLKPQDMLLVNPQSIAKLHYTLL